MENKMSCINNIHHIGYIVNDLCKAEKAMEALGYRRIDEIIREPERGIDILFMKFGDKEATYVELMKSYREESDISNIEKRMSGMPMPYHICYEVNDIDEAIEELKSQGFKKMGKTVDSLAIHNYKVCFLWQNALGLVELAQKKER